MSKVKREDLDSSTSASDDVHLTPSPEHPHKVLRLEEVHAAVKARLEILGQMGFPVDSEPVVKEMARYAYGLALWNWKEA